MASKLKGYRFVRGQSPSKKNPSQMVNWLRWDFIFQTIDGGEEIVSCFPKNGQLTARLCGVDESEIIDNSTLKQSY